MSFMDNLKKKADDLDLEGMARQVQEAAGKAARQAREKAGDFATHNRDSIQGYVEQAGAKFDEKTHDKYADTVAKVKHHVNRGVDKIAEGGHSSSDATDAAGSDVPGAAGGSDAPSAAGGPAGGAAGVPGDVPGEVPADDPIVGRDESGFDAASGDLPVPPHEALHDTTLEDVVPGHDTSPEGATLSEPPRPEDGGPPAGRNAPT